MNEESPSQEDLEEKVEAINRKHDTGVWLSVWQPGDKVKYRLNYYPYPDKTGERHLTTVLDGEEMESYLEGLEDGLCFDPEKTGADRHPAGYQ